MLQSILVSIYLFSFASAFRISTKVCPILGPPFPKPSSLSSDPAFRNAIQSLDSNIDIALRTGDSPYGSSPFNSSTFSIGVFSTGDPDLIFQRHHTDPSVGKSGVGVRKVDAETIYRIGSNGKFLSVLTFLAQVGYARLGDAVMDYIPELQSRSGAADGLKIGGIPVPPTRWEDITLGDLASQSAGLPRDYGVNDLAIPFSSPPPGYPRLPADQMISCNYQSSNGVAQPCNRSELLAGIVSEPAIFPVAQTPGYSNTGFELLGLALERITGQSMEAMFNASIVEPLGLKSTSYSQPPDASLGAIPINATISGWNADLGLVSPAGSAFSSTNDLATIGRAILSYKLLPEATTRRWLKPRSFTGGASFDVGMPWEVFVYQTDSVSASNRVYNLYTKNGGYGLYSTLFVLVPDLGLGFSVLVTSGEQSPTESETVLYLLADMIVETVLPAAEEAARRQTHAAFAGMYEASHSTGLNSSIVVATDSQPGLRVKHWISNGTDIMQELASVTSSLSVGPAPSGKYLDFRLWPNERFSPDSGKVGFTATWQILPQVIDSNAPFDLSCGAWAGVDGITYGNVGIEQFVFGLDRKSEKSGWIAPLAFRARLERT